MDNENILKLISWYEKLKSDRSNNETEWQEIAELCLPHKATFTVEKVQGESPDATKLFSSTARYAVRIFANGLLSYLINPSTKWFSFGLKKTLEISDHDNKLKELKKHEDKVYEVFNQSNFYDEILDTLMCLGPFSTGILAFERDSKDLLRYYNKDLNCTLIAEGRDRRIIAVFQEQKYSVIEWQKEKFKLTDEVKECIKNKDYNKTFKVLHVVVMRDYYDSNYDHRKKDNKSFPWASLYIDISSKELLRESGYKLFPFFACRIGKVSNSPYGQGFGSDSKPDIKMLNNMMKTLIITGQRGAEPAWVVWNDSNLYNFSLVPNAVNVINAGSNAPAPLQTATPHLPFTETLVEQVKEDIKRAFYVDRFLLLAQLNQDSTAREIELRYSENMTILAPLLGALVNELLTPAIIATHQDLIDQGALNTLEELGISPEAVEIEYVSPLAKAQKSSEIQSISNYLQYLIGLAQINPAVVDNIDIDKSARLGINLFNVPPELLRTEKEIKSIRNERSKNIQQQQMLENIKTGSEGAKNLAALNG